MSYEQLPTHSRPYAPIFDPMLVTAAQLQMQQQERTGTQSQPPSQLPPQHQQLPPGLPYMPRSSMYAPHASHMAHPQVIPPHAMAQRHIFDNGIGQQYCMIPEGYTPVLVPTSSTGAVASNPSAYQQPFVFPSPYQHPLPSVVPTAMPAQPQPRPTVPKRIPRPSNSFMTYRMDKQHEVLAYHAGANNKDISVIIGEMWRKETQPVKEYYRKKAEEGRKEHALRYPGYRYTPLKKRNSAGTSSAAAGAKKHKLRSPDPKPKETNAKAQKAGVCSTASRSAHNCASASTIESGDQTNPASENSTSDTSKTSCYASQRSVGAQTSPSPRLTIRTSTLPPAADLTSADVQALLYEHHHALPNADATSYNILANPSVSSASSDDASHNSAGEAPLVWDGLYWDCKSKPSARCVARPDEVV
ncbi:hypothetical protein DFJ77DRAFT_505831 [Powellomyces hirtus]|nr:hypothetical protein DFJ77DRAFT_505831 [Powellomyces hirtus]